MGNVLKSRLKALLAERNTSARAVSMKATGKPDTIRDIMRDRTDNPRTDTLEAIAAVLGTDISYLTGNAAARGSRATDTTKGGLVPARVVGLIQAGAFMEAVGHDVLEDDPQYVATVKDRDFPRLVPIAFQVVGDSIDKKVEAGGYVVCIPFADTGLQLKDGMWVVAERVRGDTVERTVKQVRLIGKRFELHPASNNPAHRPIRFPSAEAHEEVRVVALVRRFIGPLLPV